MRKSDFACGCLCRETLTLEAVAAVLVIIVVAARSRCRRPCRGRGVGVPGSTREKKEAPGPSLPWPRGRSWIHRPCHASSPPNPLPPAPPQHRIHRRCASPISDPPLSRLRITAAAPPHRRHSASCPPPSYPPSLAPLSSDPPLLRLTSGGSAREAHLVTVAVIGSSLTSTAASAPLLSPM